MVKERKTVQDFSGFLRQRRERARRAAQEAMRKEDMLQEMIPLFRKYGVSRAYLFGSVLTGACRKDSDIDLYVEEIDPEQYWELWKDLESQSGEAIDLHCDRDDPLFIKKIRKRGRLIYEAGHSPLKG